LKENSKEETLKLRSAATGRKKHCDQDKDTENQVQDQASLDKKGGGGGGVWGEVTQESRFKKVNTGSVQGDNRQSLKKKGGGGGVNADQP